MSRPTNIAYRGAQIILIWGIILIVFGVLAYRSLSPWVINLFDFTQIQNLLILFPIIFGFIALFIGLYNIRLIKSQDKISISETKQIKSNDKTEDNDAINILNIRYAKGEINKEQFEHMKKDIES